MAPVSDIVLSGKEFTAGILALTDDLQRPGVAARMCVSALLLMAALVLVC